MTRLEEAAKVLDGWAAGEEEQGDRYEARRTRAEAALLRAIDADWYISGAWGGGRAQFEAMTTYPAALALADTLLPEETK